MGCDLSSDFKLSICMTSCGSVNGALGSECDDDHTFTMVNLGTFFFFTGIYSPVVNV